MARLSAALLLALAATGAAAEICTYTEERRQPGDIALGFPVPVPVDAQAPVAGFRRYEALLANLERLALESPEFSRVVVGASREGREIVGFELGDGDGRSPDGQLLPAAVLHSGGIHAREWISTEAVAFVAERMLAGLGEPGLERYLADTLTLLWIPVLNPDGFLSSQRHAGQTRIAAGCEPEGIPRDGRMRRKNHLDTDGDLATADDSLLGVDLNRNIGPLWDSANQSSADPESIFYKGPARESEPETRALLAAAARLGDDALRLYIDTHSFGRVLFFNEPGKNQRLDLITRSLATTIGRVSSPSYAAIAEQPTRSFGATEEQFALVQQVPAYTLEIEPGSGQATEYGGNPVSRSGFILPDTEVARVREEIYQLSRLAYYHQAGPPSLERLEIRRTDTGEQVFSGHRAATGGRRETVISASTALEPGRRYRLSLRFNKPMRLRDDRGQISNYAGQSVTLSPVVTLRAGGAEQALPLADDGWLGIDRLRYDDDSWAVDFTLDEALRNRSQVTIAVTVSDLSGLALDARPETVAGWADGHWTGYEDSEGRAGDSGGTDAGFCIGIVPAGPTANCGGPLRGGSGSGSFSRPDLWLLLVLACLAAYTRAPHRACRSSR